MRFEVTILGSNSAIPAHGRFPTSQILNASERLYLIDCGEGVQWRLQDCDIKKSKINQIFISHLHGDHIYGLIGLLNSMSLSKRTSPITIFSPKGLEEIIQVQLKYAGTVFSFPLTFYELETNKNQLIFEDEVLNAYTIPLRHRIPTCGFLFIEKPRPLNIDPDKIEKFNIPVEKIIEIKNGADFITQNGKLIANAALTFPPVSPRSYAFCSDTAYDTSIISIVEGVNLLYHESTFLHELQDLAKETMHSTTIEAATIAKKAKVGQLILGHYSSRYQDLSPLLEEAQKVFSNTVLGVEGKTISVEEKRRKIQDS